jgi:type I restriction enzyme S subunit
MPDERDVQLGEVSEVFVGFPFRSEHYATEGDGLRLLRGDNVGQGELRWSGAKFWPRSMADGIDAYRLRAGDIVLAMDRPWIEAGLKYARVAEADLPALLVQRVARLRGSSSLDAGFLRYLIGSRAFTEHVLAVQTGTAVPHISGSQIKSFRFRLPSIERQRSIASLLGALDDKIDLNRRMNETLEAMARALFRDWFVDFGPTRAKMEGRTPYLAPEVWSLFPDALGEDGLPVGWRIVSFLETVEVLGGGTPSTQMPAYWSGAIPWFSVVDAPRPEDAWVIQTQKRITEAGLAASPARLLPVGTTIISARGTVGRLALVGTPMAMNQSCYALQSTGGAFCYFTYFSTAALVDELKRRAHGSVFDTITRDSLASVGTIEPAKPIAEAFEEQVSPLLDRMLLNVRESETLASLRDLLLPRLMSGELRVRDAEALVEAAQ